MKLGKITVFFVVLRSENLTKHYLCQGIFYMFFSTLEDIIEA